MIINYFLKTHDELEILRKEFQEFQTRLYIKPDKARIKYFLSNQEIYTCQAFNKMECKLETSNFNFAELQLENEQILIDYLFFIHSGYFPAQKSIYFWIILSDYFKLKSQILIEIVFKNTESFTKRLFMKCILILLSSQETYNLHTIAIDSILEKMLQQNLNFLTSEVIESNSVLLKQNLMKFEAWQFRVVSLILHRWGYFDTIETLYQFLKNIPQVDLVYYSIMRGITKENTTGELQYALENHYDECFHMVHNSECDMMKRAFKSQCGHWTCLKCFFEYFHFKVRLNQPRLSQFKYEIRCLSRLTDISICEKSYTYKDFAQLKQDPLRHQFEDIFNQYIK